MSVDCQILFFNTSTASTYRQKEIRDVVRDVDRDTHVREMESITTPDERQRDQMMENQLFKILPRFLKQQHQHDSLLRPITALQKIIRLERRLVRPVREPLHHARRVEIPHRRLAHDIQPKRPKDAKVHRRVELFHEPALLGSFLNPPANRQRSNESLHQELSGEREEDDVERHELEVLGALAVHNRRIRCSVGRARLGVR